VIAGTNDRAQRLFEGLSVAMRVHRARLKLTQEEAARRAGLNARHWSEIERGKKRPGLDSALGIAEALDRPLPALLQEAIDLAP
jgi:transcriptional regulator with XRE-family HTH domain